jgi:hypothetical protein
LRAVFKQIDTDKCIFTEIGTHGALYS